MSRVIVTPLLLLYSPIGLCLVIIRSLLLIYVFLASVILYTVSPVKRVVLRLMCTFLGFIVTSEGVARGSRERPYVSNCATLFDHMVLSLLTNSVTPHKFMLSWALSWRPLNYEGLDDGNRFSDVYHLQPEETPTGSHLPYLIKFNTAPFRLYDTVQPVAISVSTSLPIHLSIHPIDWKYEIFWLLFTPVVRVHVKFLEPMTKCSDNDKPDEVFADSVRQEIAKNLNKKTMDWDKSRLLSVSEENVPTPKEIAVQSKAADVKVGTKLETVDDESNNSNKHHVAVKDPRIEQVLAVIPDGNPSTVEMLLNRMGDVDSVIATLLEQTDHCPSKAPTSVTAKYLSPSSHRLAADTFSKNTNERHKSFADRKAMFLENARQRYLEVHPDGSA